MLRTVCLTVISALVITGCTTTTPEERQARDRNTCAGYGFTANSDAFANCMMQLDLDRRTAQRERLARPPAFARPIIVVQRPQQTETGTETEAED